MERFFKEHAHVLVFILVIVTMTIGLICGMKIGYAQCMKQHHAVTSEH